MIDLDIFSNMAKPLVKVKSLTNKDTAMLKKLSIVILIRDFYQFFLIVNYPLLNEEHIEEKYYSKMF